MSVPEVIVIADQPIYDVLAASGVPWNLQHRVATVGQMWDGLTGGTLSQGSSILFFSDAIVADAGELEAAIATMAPHSVVFVATSKPESASDLDAGIRASAAAMGSDGPFYFVPVRDEKGFLDSVKRVIQDHTSLTTVQFPEVWGEVTGLFHGQGHVQPLAEAPALDVEPVAPVPVYDPAPALDVEPVYEAPQEAPAPVALAPVALAPVALAPVAPAPVAPAPVAPAPVAPAPVAPAPVVPAPVVPAPVAPAPATVAPVAPRQPLAPQPMRPLAPVGPVSPGPVGLVTPVGPVSPPVAAPGRVPDAAGAPVAAPIAYQAPQHPARVPGGPVDGYVAPASCTTLCFFSSKGGSGKSTTALMTATTIAHASEAAGHPLKVALVDMDTRDGQVASLIGTYAPTALNIRVAEDWDEETVLKNLVHSDKLKIDCLLAPIRPRTADDVGPEFYRHVIRVLQQTHDVVIMDCSVNYLDPLISTVCLPEAKAVLFVTTMATTAVQGMARALREITEPLDKGGMGIPRSKIGIVVNQSVQNVGLDKEQVTQAALNVPLVGAIPLATTDVLKATNSNKMHFLVNHPVLGPAYTKLARVCLPDADLSDLQGVPVPPGRQAPAPVQAATHAPAVGVPAPGQYAAPEQASDGASPTGPQPVDHDSKPGRSLLGFKKKV